MQPRGSVWVGRVPRLLTSDYEVSFDPSAIRTHISVMMGKWRASNTLCDDHMLFVTLRLKNSSEKLYSLIPSKWDQFLNILLTIEGTLNLMLHQWSNYDIQGKSFATVKYQTFGIISKVILNFFSGTKFVKSIFQLKNLGYCVLMSKVRWSLVMMPFLYFLQFLIVHHTDWGFIHWEIRFYNYSILKSLLWKMKDIVLKKVV